jgi:predicted RNA-binding protein
LLHAETDFIHIAKEKMSAYFPNPQDTYIFISPQHIIDILLVTFVSRIDSNEYEICEPIDNDVYIAIISKIRNSDNLSDRFKQEFFNFLE